MPFNTRPERIALKTLIPVAAALAVLAGCATKPASSIDPSKIPVAQVFGHALMDNQPLAERPVVQTNHPAVLNAYAGQPWRLMKFRPNINLPEMVDVDVINNNPTLDINKANAQFNNNERLIFTLPRLNIIPCDEGCIGNMDYEKAVQAFIKSYSSLDSGKGVAPRGVMKVKVRWFNQRGYLQKVNPLSLAQDVFAIQFPIEGNLVTISASSFGTSSDINKNVEKVANNFKIAVVLPVTYGLRNNVSMALDPSYDPSAMQKAGGLVAPVVRGLQKVLGQTDYSSRIEPMAADNPLLPAIDGIKPGELVKLNEPFLFN